MKHLLTMLVLLGWAVCASGFAAEAPANAAPSVIGDGRLELTVPSSVNAPFSHSLSKQSLAFTQNVGQWPDSILFRASAGGTVMWFTNDGIWYQFTKHIKKNATGEEALAAGLGPRRPDMADTFGHERDSIETALVKAQFVGANPHAAVVGLEEQAYKCNYFLGNDPAKWHADVPNYSAVSMRGIYPGVDATFRGKDGTVELVLSGPAEAVRKVTTAYRGAPASSQPDGSIILSTRLGDKRFDGMLPASSELERVTLSAATSTSNLTLAYSTYLGGGGMDWGYGIAVDGAGNAYVTGCTYSSNFPTQNAYQTDQDYTYDAFVTKLSAAGNSLVYSTYLGGDSADIGNAIAVDGAGNAYVTGYTLSTNFPTQNAYQTDQGSDDVFVTKLSASGTSLVYSTYLGGTIYDYGYDIAVDGAGNAYVTGGTTSTNFPTQNAYQTDQGYEDVFVTKLSVSGSSLVYSTYLGGSSGESASDIAVDGAGNAYVTGITNSTDFPTQSPYQTDQGTYDAFVTKLSASGSSLVYSTYLGGSDNERGYGIAVDGADNAYVTGYTYSTTFPTQTPYQTDQGVADVFVTKLSASGSSLVYSTYLGGYYDDYGYGIAVDGAGNAYVTGYTGSNNFPTQNAYDAAFNQVFVTRLSADGTSLVYSTYLGGSSYGEGGSGIAVDGAGNAYVTGKTGSTDFPTQNAYQTDQGADDVFVTKLGFTASCCIGVTGNVNMQDIVDVSDLSLLVSYLTSNPPPVLLCEEEANINGIGIIDVSDLSFLVAYLTASPPPTLPSCP